MVFGGVQAVAGVALLSRLYYLQFVHGAEFKTLAEGNRAGATWLHVAGALLLAGRLMHPFGLKVAQPSHPMRIAGNTASLLAMLSMVVCLLVTLFQR